MCVQSEKMKRRKRKETGVDVLPEKVQKVVHSEKKKPNIKLVKGQDATVCEECESSTADTANSSVR